MLAIAVSKQLSKRAAAAADQKSRKSNQALSAITSYLTGSDWKKLHGNTTAIATLGVVVDRLWKVGLTCPSGTTIKYMVAVVAAAHCPDAGSWHIACHGT